MLVQELISQEIPPLKLTDTVAKALDWMDQFKVSHLAVTDGRKLLGLISENDLLDSADAELLLSEHKTHLLQCFVFEHQHAYDVLRLMSSLELSLIPVLNATEHYQGSISTMNLIHHLSTMASVEHPGGVLVLEMNQNDYSASQIAQIVESNNAKLLSLHVSSSKTSTRLEVTLKVNRESVADIIQTLHRYQYTIKASFETGDYSKQMEDRFKQFWHYLNM